MTDPEAEADPAPISVLIVDDQDLVRLGLAMVVGAEPGLRVAGEAADGRAAIEQARRLRPDVILMDVRMPRQDGIETTRQLIAELPDSRVIILTTFDLDEYAFGGLHAGASGFLLKDSTKIEIINGIRAVASGEACVSPRITRRMLDLFGSQFPGAAEAVRAERVRQLEDLGELEQLTGRERDVLLAVARGLSNQEIADELQISESTIKTHVGRILLKLGFRDRVQAVVWAHQNRLLD
ncbi:response regulator [Microlunatus soli]|uniref:DNA-binding response regulator, NarL/FixJ family, contains REC and HTH domains n=1 Tax=Microlunatus soli TaxID=630515 RepID=A0A1H1TH37_9ACTN|nr:response regulator transcription factor [Microlunatus soli]SDS59563.1 DNA-binding response regulator, NarL/FixJ family, contains REC and HTH domains [Microlunatus soli]